MALIKSQRALNLLKTPRAIDEAGISKMRKYPNSEWNIWVNLEREQLNVKNLSFAGTLSDLDKVLLEAVAALMKGKPTNHLENMSLRECEAFLRDRNSELAIEEIVAADEEKFKKFFVWLRIYPINSVAQEYQFSSQKGPFRSLKLVEKVKEIKGFLNSFEIQELYQGSPVPELIDVDDLTVFVQVPYFSDRDKALFEELHVLGVSTFQEENLNFIPEA